MTADGVVHSMLGLMLLAVVFGGAGFELGTRMNSTCLQEQALPLPDGWTITSFE
jgi:hypothetical protein